MTVVLLDDHVIVAIICLCLALLVTLLVWALVNAKEPRK